MDFNNLRTLPSVFLLLFIALISPATSQYTPGNGNGYSPNNNGQGYVNQDVACGVCPIGFQREQSYGPYCGRCVPETISCKQGSYLEGNECVRCPCPGTDPFRQHATGCQKDVNGQILCQCEKNYVGAQCDQCAPGCIQRDYYPYDCYQPGETQTCQGIGCSQQCVGTGCSCSGSSCQQSCSGSVCSCLGQGCSCTGQGCQSSCNGGNCQQPCSGSSCACSGFHCRQPPPQLCPGCGCRGTGCGCDTCHFDRHHHHHHNHVHIVQCNSTSSTCKPDYNVYNNYTMYNITNVNNKYSYNVTNITQQNSIVQHNINYYSYCATELCVCDPRGTERQYGGICVCKNNVEGANCNRCKKGYFGLDRDNPDGCSQCFCSGLSRLCGGTCSCSVKDFFQDYIRLRRPHGFQLTDRVQNLIPITGNDIVFTFGPSTRKDLYWYLPHYFLGTRTTSYGGRLSARRMFTTFGSTSSTRSTDVIIMSSYGTSIYWTSPNVFASGVTSILEVTLDDRSGWIIDRHNYSSVATRWDIMEVLSDVQKILIRATLADKDRMESTSLSDVTLTTASTSVQSDQGLTVTIEACDCPAGYQGFSCESCSPGYYRDYTDMTRGVFGACKICPCGRNSEGCYLENMEIVCICKEGFSGPKCTDCESLSISVNPIKCRDCYDALITFNCSYVTTRTGLTIELKTIPDWSSLQNYAGAPRPGVTFPGRRNGASIVATIPLLRQLNKVVCSLSDSRREIVAEARSTVMGEVCTLPPPFITPGYFNVTPEFLCINTTQTATFRCQASIPVHWYRERPWSVVRSTPNGEYLEFSNSNPYANPVTPSASGTYVCVGRDGNSVFTKKVELLVRDSSAENCQQSYILQQPKQPSVQPGLYQQQPAVQPGQYEQKPAVQPGQYQQQQRPDLVVTNDQQPPYKNDVISKPEEPSPDSDDDDDDDDYEWNDAPRESPPTNTSLASRGNNGDLPRVYIYPTIQRVPVGQQARFKCTATGDSVRVHWQVESGGQVELQTAEDGTLYFPAVSKADERNYICIGINGAGKSIAKSSLVVLESTFGLTVSSSPPAHVAQIGQQIIFSCDSRDRVIDVRWQKEGGTLPQNSAQYPNGSLVIPAIEPSNAGWYICSSVSRSGESATAKLQLTVKQPANVTLVTGPHVKIHPVANPFLVSSGENIRIHCHATGEPIPRLTWSRSMMSPGGTSTFERKLVEAQTLKLVYELTEVSVDDSGDYKCTARSAAGVHQATIAVVVSDRDSSDQQQSHQRRHHHRQRN